MKRFKIYLVAMLAAIMLPATASAQLYEIANQLPQLISPALSGSLKYRGFVEASYLQGLGNTRANFVDFSTSQGFQYADWFYMGVGIGADIFMSNYNGSSVPGQSNFGNSGFDYNHSSSTTAFMVPLFTDFRFNLGGQNSASLFLDLKLGCSFLCTNNYIRINNGYLTNQEYFYLKPTIGCRIPVSSSHPKQSVNVGITYQLLTSNYWSVWSRNVTLNSLGASVAFEW